MDQLFANTPFWLWILLAALLGAAAMWSYWRCIVQENEALAEAAIAEREDELARIHADFDENPLGRGPASPPVDSNAALGAESANDEEMTALRYRVWALETRLRRIHDGLRAGEEIDPAIVGEGLEDVTGDGAPPREVAELKYAAWRAEQDGSPAPQAPIEPSQMIPSGETAEPGAAAAMAARADLLQRRLDRALASAKGGRLDELTEIEREAAADKAALSARFGSAFEPAGDGQPASLRFRNWLLSATLTRVLEQARAGWPIDPNAVSEELEAASRGAALVDFPEDAPNEPETPENDAPVRIAELERSIEELTEQNSGLRYQLWSQEQQIESHSAETQAAALLGATDESDGVATANAQAVEALTAALAESEAALAAAIAEKEQTIAAVREENDELLALAQSEAEELRFSLDDARSELEDVRAEATEEASAEAARALAAELTLLEAQRTESEQKLIAERSETDRMRMRVRDLEDESMRLFNEKRAALDANAEAERRIRTRHDEEKRLRQRAVQAETALRTVRAHAASLPKLSSELEHSRADAARLKNALAASDARLWSAEWRLANAQSRLATSASVSADAERRDALADERRRMRSDATVLRSRLWAAEWRIKEQTEELEELTSPDAAGSPEVRAEIDALRAQLAVAQDQLAVAEARPAPMDDPQVQSEIAGLREQLGAAEDQLAAALARPAPMDDPTVRAELDALRNSLSAAEGQLAAAMSRPEPREDPHVRAEMEALSEDADRRRREAETLRTRLALIESETAKLRSELGDRRAEPTLYDQTLPQKIKTAGAALAAARSHAASKPDPFAARMRGAATQSVESQVPERLRSELHAVRKTPLWGVESAALELIENGAVVAITSNRPQCLLDTPDNGAPDDLPLIAEVTPKMAEAMRKIGLFYFHQFEECSPSDLAWIDDRLSLRGAVVRERWTPQARQLAEWKRESRLVVGSSGVWTATTQSFSASPASSAPQQPTPPEIAPAFEGPMSGAEYAMLDLIGDPRFEATDANKPEELRRIVTRQADDLARLQGVDGALADSLAALGVTTYQQLAEMSPQSGAWIDRRLNLGGRVARDRWQPQARMLEQQRAAAPAQAAYRQVNRTVVPEPKPPYTGQTSATEPQRVSPSPRPVEPGTPEGRETEAQRLIQSGSVSVSDPAPTGLYHQTPTGGADDLKLIQTIGPKLEARLNALGVYGFDQLARFNASELAWIDVSLNLSGRVAREGWARQAADLSRRKEAGELSVGGEGSWTLQSRGAGVEEALQTVRNSPYSQVEVAAMQMISGEAPAVDLHRPSSLLSGPSGASPDDLKLIRGVGPQLEQLLNDLGIYYFSQIAEFSAQDLAWVDQRLQFKGRIIRDRWSPQAALLARR